MPNPSRALGLAVALALPLAPLPASPSVELSRFMGDWYVIANIPTPIEKDAYNAFESYASNPDGTIAATFRFRKGGFDGSERTYHPKGFVEPDGTNAVWGMRFVWPIKAEYRIAWLNPDYTMAVIARSKRDYVWIMARTPSIPEADYARLVELVGVWGYDTAKIRRVPQCWPSSARTGPTE
jgi:apolipoprotein D and lipocalin family protein